MAALGYTATAEPILRALRAPQILSRKIALNTGAYGETFKGLSGRDDEEGNAAPCLKIGRYGPLSFRMACAVGERTLSVQVKQPDADAERPYVKLRANPDIGLDAPLTTTATSSTGWQTLTVTFTADANGGVWVELWNADMGTACWFDNLSLT